MNFNFRLPFFVDPEMPQSPRERTISIRLPKWLAYLLGDQEKRRLLINIRMEPPG